ncbi:hypothetical protein DPMN_181981 [Dreissena polymorpha]|uniref:Uncharacterized protein n=1 Tax=Dreissena polymorpha TaxID=45954 RepID=A0A9D4DDW2_DREPO|nr:hypothetical protein DPMN_181981 [Dreissena polymorpha]
MIHIGLSLLTVALESGADNISLPYLPGQGRYVQILVHGKLILVIPCEWQRDIKIAFSSFRLYVIPSVSPSVGRS